MEEQAFRRLPARLSNALVHKFPSMLEYKSPTSLDMPEIFTDLIEHPDPQGRSARRKSARDRCCRSCRRWPTRCTTRSACASIRFRSRRRRSCARCRRRPPASRRDRTGGVSRDRLAGAAARGAAVGRRRRPRVERAEAPLAAEGRGGRRGDRGGAVMMRLPGVPLSRAAHASTEAAAWLAERSREHDAARRRHRSAAEHEAAAADAGDAHRPARRAASFAEIRNGDGLTIGAGVTLSSLDRTIRGSGSRTRAVAGGRAGRDAAPAQHGHASAATCASTRAAPTTTRTTSGARRSTSA